MDELYLVILGIFGPLVLYSIYVLIAHQKDWPLNWTVIYPAYLGYIIWFLFDALGGQSGAGLAISGFLWGAHVFNAFIVLLLALLISWREKGFTRFFIYSFAALLIGFCLSRIMDAIFISPDEYLERGRTWALSRYANWRVR